MKVFKAIVSELTGILLAFIIGCISGVENSVVNQSQQVSECIPVKSGTYPNVWLEVADPRTASTLQFTALILIAHRICDGVGIKWNYLQRLWAPTLSILNNPDPATLQIIKTHDHDFIRAAKNDTWIFTATRNKKTQTQWLKANFADRWPFKAIQVLNDVTNGSYSIIENKYKRIFNLTAEDVRDISEVMSHWEKLRRCCGAQMSDSWRDHLHSANIATTNRVGDVHHNSGHECLSYGQMADVESQYISASQRYHFPLIEFDQVGQCDCSIKLTMDHKLGFNDYRYEACTS